MCGLAGQFLYGRPSGETRVDTGELRRYSKHMRARGPDDEGTWLSSDNRVGLVHRRLAIAGSEAGGRQPFVETGGGIVVAFNGEIYNFRELREQMRRAGMRFRTDGEAEVLAKLYRVQGRAMVRRLQGMFAIAVWDGRRRGLLLARDALGIKPLYMSADEGVLRFASQVRTLIAGGRVETAHDPAGWAGFLAWGAVPEPWTAFRAIRAVRSGEVVWTDEGGPQTESWFSVDEVLKDAGTSGWTSGGEGKTECSVAMSVRESVRRHSANTAGIGTFLSGGSRLRSDRIMLRGNKSAAAEDDNGDVQERSGNGGRRARPRTGRGGAVR